MNFLFPFYNHPNRDCSRGLETTAARFDDSNGILPDAAWKLTASVR